MTETNGGETQEGVFAFQAEVTQVLDLVIHSLYRNKEIFLRELVSNASDALDKLRFAAITQPELAAGAPLEIRIRADEAAGTLAIEDTGVGMTRDELIRNLGTIAHSGTKAFLAAHAQAAGDLSLIGQFGVGFYSAFLVADRVEVVSRAAGSGEAWRWTSSARASFQVTPAERDVCGTSITLHVRDDQRELCKDWKLRALIERYSDFVEHPIRLVPAEGEAQTLNRAAALWMRSPAEVEDDAYTAFYKHLTHDWEAPLARTHFKIEGNQLFRALLFVPKRAPMDLFDREAKHGVRLYVRRVFIMDDCDDLLPSWLRFVRGVVDSDDLPLNVSREVLQDSAAARVIRKQVVKKVLDLLEEVAANRADEYTQFWGAFGKVLKEGLYFEPEHKERLARLLRFESSAARTELVSLQQYVDRMVAGQPAIYYALGSSRATVEAAPHTERLRKRGYEVLYLTDPVDQWAISNLDAFSERPLVSVASSELDLAELDSPESGDGADAPAVSAGLVEAFKAVLGDRVQDVRPSKRLEDSPACVVIPEGGLPSHIERMLRANNQVIPPTPRILELNATHPVILGIDALRSKRGSDEEVQELVHMIFDQALLAEGTPLEDPARFARGLTRLMTAAFAKRTRAARQPVDAS